MFSFARRFSVASVAPDTGAQQLPYPVAPCPPIAVFSADFAATSPVVRLQSVDELSSSGVATVAAPFPILRTIDVAAWTPEFPMIVLSTYDRGLLAPEDRDFIWNTFGVPVFEYLLDSQGRLVARECEAHEGLHLAADIENLPGIIVDEACACGKSSSRLLGLEDIIEKSIAVSALPQEWRNWQTHQT